MGHRVTGDPRDSVVGAGWEFLFVAVDDHARIGFTQMKPDERQLAVAVDDHARIGFTQMKPDERQLAAVAFLRACVAYFASLGVTIRRVLTDNGSAFRFKRFATACRKLKLKHVFTRAYRPQTNGKAERFIQSALREWAYGIPLSAFNRAQRHAQALDASLQLASPAPGHWRRRTHVPTRPKQKQPLDASHLARCSQSSPLRAWFAVLRYLAAVLRTKRLRQPPRS
jgi:transposase InsO family protein